MENGEWDDGGTANKTVNLIGKEGDTLALAATDIPAVGSKPNEGYKEGTWDTEPKAGEAISQAVTYTYAYAEANETDPETETFTVTFETDGGEPVPAEQTVEAGKTAEEPNETPAKSGYDFDGWFREKEAETPWDFETYTIEEDTVIYAGWTKGADDTFTVTFDVCGHGEAPEAYTDVLYGSLIDEPDTPTAEGWIFVAWYKDEELSEKWDFADDTVTEDVTLFAKWRKPSSGGSSTSSGSSTGGDTTYPVIVNPTVGGEVKAPTKAAQGDKVRFTVTPEDGYELDSITAVDGNGKAVTVKKKKKNTDGKWFFEMPGAKVTITVTFKKTAAEPEPLPEQGPEPEPSVGEAPERPFLDVPEGSWFYDAVYYCFDKGWYNGMSSDTFGPNLLMTRAMFVTVLYRQAGSPEVTGDSAFTDVVAGTWYYNAVLWAEQKGIIKGYENGRFGIDDPLTREQMVTILWRMAGEPAASADLSSFQDSEKISPWAKEAILWAVSEGIIQGKPGGILDPGGFTTRAEVAQVLMNMDTKD